MDICFFNVYVLLYLLMGFFFLYFIWNNLYKVYIYIWKENVYSFSIYFYDENVINCFDVSLGIFVLYDRIIKIRKSMFKICKINNDILVYWGFNIKEVCCIVV